jgi:hypothetical protein
MGVQHVFRDYSDGDAIIRVLHEMKGKPCQALQSPRTETDAG